jgi:hypothetical protein
MADSKHMHQLPFDWKKAKASFFLKPGLLSGDFNI